MLTTSHPFYHPRQFGLPQDAKVLISYDGGIVSRTAQARRLVREMGRDRKFKPSRSAEYLQFLRNRMQDRITYLSYKRDIEQDMDSAFIDPLVEARAVIDKILTPL